MLDDQRAVVDDRPRTEGSIGPSVADLQGAGRDHSGTGVDIRSQQDRGAGADLGECAGAGNGIARAGKKSEITTWNVIGRALEDKTTTGLGMIEAVVKLNS